MCLWTKYGFCPRSLSNGEVQLISRNSVLNMGYNFVRVCPNFKFGITGKIDFALYWCKRLQIILLLLQRSFTRLENNCPKCLAKGRTIRKLIEVGGGGGGEVQKNIRARENSMKKILARQLILKNIYAMA